MAETKPTSQPNHLTQYVDGFPIPASFSPDIFRSALNYKPHNDDVFIVSYPKCGATWAQYVLHLIFRHGQTFDSNLDFFKVAPLLELAGAKFVEELPRPMAIKLHLPYQLTPRSEIAKYIYVTRNPKDCCVSLYHHMKEFPNHHFNGTFDEFFELFTSGNIDFGDYFDHLLSWYEHRNDPNVLFLTYEEMKLNTEACILKMASFVDDKLYGEPLRKDTEKLNNTIKHSRFENMKDVINKGLNEMFSMSADDILKSNLPDQAKKVCAFISEANKAGQKPVAANKAGFPNFVRKGIIGDWKNYFNDDQNKRMNEKFSEKTKGTGIPSWWEEYMKWNN